MKKLFLFTCLFLFILMASGQKKKLPSFGKIDRSDLEYKECPYDIDAEAEVLLETGEVFYNITNTIMVETKKRVRIKILKDKGIEYANIKLRYYNKDRLQDINNLAGYTYNLDESGNIKVSKLEKSAIFDKPLDKRYSELSFTMPEVKAGSVIEYRYSVIEKSIDVNDWYFQRDIPVRYSSYMVKYPSILDIREQVTHSLPLDFKKDETSDSYLKTYVMENVPGLHEEPYMSSSHDYLQRIEFQLAGYRLPLEPYVNLMGNWPKLVEALLEDEDFGSQLNKKIEGSSGMLAKAKALDNDYSKMCMVYDYVRSNMNWSGRYGFYSLNGVKSAWDKKNGSLADINLILINLLRDADVEAYPLLVSTRDNGRVNSAMPIVSQFDAVLAYVQMGDKYYVLDATEKYTPACVIPPEVMFTDGLIVDKDKISWKFLGSIDHKKKLLINMMGNITPEGKLKGEAFISAQDYARINRNKVLKQDEEKFKETYLSNSSTNISISDLKFKNTDADTLGLEQTFKFEIPVNGSGDYSYFNTNLFTGLEKNPFIADKRTTDIEFGCLQSFTINGMFTLPESYELETPPKSMRMIMPDTSIVFERYVTANTNTVSIRIKLDFTRPTYYVDNYPVFKEFYKQLFAALNEDIVLKKKS